MSLDDTINALPFKMEHRFAYAALQAIEEECAEYMKFDDGLLYHASPIWRLIDSHVVRLSEVPPAVIRLMPSIIAATEKLHEEVTREIKEWDKLEGSEVRRTHDDVRNLSEAPKIANITTELLTKWRN